MFKETSNPDLVIRVSDGAFVPRGVVDNRDWQECQRWLDAGNTLLPADVLPSPVPASITRRQLLLQMLASGMITAQEALDAAQLGSVPIAVNAVFNTLPAAARVQAEITWACMSIAERSNPLVAMLAASHGMTDVQTDDFFRAAALL